jgi:hypothetical protein
MREVRWGRGWGRGGGRGEGGYYVICGYVLTTYLPPLVEGGFVFFYFLLYLLFILVDRLVVAKDDVNNN